MTVTETSLRLGPRPQYLRRLLEDDFEDPDAWEHHLVETYAIWIAGNETIARINALSLLATQFTLVTGVIFVTIGVLF